MIEATFFYVFSAVLLISAAMTVCARNPVHAVLYMILAFFNAAGLFVMLGAEFIAMIMAIVYVGAVAVLFLFVVMMLDVDFATRKKNPPRYMAAAALVAGVLGAEMVWLYSGWKPSQLIERILNQPIPDDMANTQALGALLYTQYAYLLEVSGLILLVAMIGAIVLTHRTREGVRRQDISKQVSRDPKDVLKIEKIESGAGVS